MAIIRTPLIRGSALGQTTGGIGVNLLTQGRARGLLRKTGILDDAFAQPEAHAAQGEVDMYRMAMGLANGMQNPVQFKMEFSCPRGISQPVLIPAHTTRPSSRMGFTIPGQEIKQSYNQAPPEGYVRGGGIDWRTHKVNHSVSGSASVSSGTIRSLYEDAAQVAKTLWIPYGRRPGIEKADTVLNLFCSKVTIPEKSINFASMRHYGTHFAFPQSVQYGTLSTTFYCDASMKIKKYFDAWQKLIYNDITGNFNYYDEFISNIDIFTRAGVATDKFEDIKKSPSNPLQKGVEKLNEWTGQGGPKSGDIKIPKMEFRNTYGIKVLECWPQIVGGIDLGHASTNSVAEFSVTWVYKKWNTWNLGEITKRGDTINMSAGVYKDQADGLPFIRDLPQELQGPLNESIDQKLMTSPLVNFNSFTG